VTALHGKRLLVTGAARGIGEEIVCQAIDGGAAYVHLDVATA
jgi:NAD(P)-dependent dehydrogenase (short-subunit alcohol dehydrogenase family)